jgi:acyl transferase domain-containing protein/NAD(P)H-dependent flavin oxidoreductase YrpB (nitropropane dioxygenase family)/acyl carrier protein
MSMNSARLTHAALPSILAVTPQHRLAPAIAIAAGRASALGVLDLGLRTPDAAMAAAVRDLLRHAGTQGCWGLRLDLFGAAAAALNGLAGRIGLDEPAPAQAPSQVPTFLLAGTRPDELRQATRLCRRLARTVLLEVRDLAEALAAQAAGADGVVLKGNEAGGRVGRRSAFMLAQECAGKLRIPYWLQGGIGIHTAGAAVLAGAAGVVLGEQLWRTAEAPADPRWTGLDGSETAVAGAEEAPYRCFARSGKERLRGIERALAQGDDWQAPLLDGLLAVDDGILAVGADIGLAEPLAARYGTVGRIVTAVRAGIDARPAQAGAQLAFKPDAALAQAHGTRYPIVQGPMTRVSDVAPFAAAVGAAGALPFLALAVLRGPEVAALLERTRAAMGSLPWGVGLLGFLPRALREEQMAVLRDLRPPFAIIAGGRPGQARELEALGTVAYLHVPSPGLLRSFLDAGARRFVFEGSECGGHTGPRSSFVLWEQAIGILADAALPDPDRVQVLFAGGIHDALSAAMVASMAAPLVALGMKVGVLMGTAYLFTEEIVGSGAVVEEFQRQARDCTETALLQSGVGIYTRCARTAFCAEFDALRRQSILERKSEEDTLMALELMNIGRLRIAAKGIVRNPDPDAPAERRHVAVAEDVQRRDGLYMLGDVARLRDGTCTLAELHEDVALGSSQLLQERLARQPAAPPRTRGEPVAIVGMAAHFPKAQDLRAYWRNIVRGVDAVREVDDARWPAAQLFDPQRRPDKVYAKWGGFLDDIAFDPRRYGIAPATLRSIEPAQLLTLEVARQALEDAGFDRRPFARERTTCIVAVGGMNDLGTTYNFRTVLPLYLARVEGLPEDTRKHIVDTLFERDLPAWTEDSFPGILGNVIAGRIANRLDLGGSNFTVDAACASSLAALEAGFRQLRDGLADVALVGGVDCTNSPLGFMCFAQTHALSPRGRSRPFDAGADGIAISEGVGAVVLKRLADAERDGDRIYALVDGIGSASDGRHRSLTAPHPPGQVATLQRAYADAGIDPRDVTLVEAHGTGTALGDRSEVAALDAVMGRSGRPVCALGSVKSTIGHTKVAAGLAGLIKAALALQHRVLPPTAGVEQPLASLREEGCRLYVNSELRPWLHLGRGHPRHCGVSAFGFGGTNFHAVLSEYTGGYRPGDAPSLLPREVELFAFAGADRGEVERAAAALLEGLARAPDIELAQLAYSLYREQHLLRRANGGQPCRLVVVAASVEELRARLGEALARIAAGEPARPSGGVYYRESAGAVGGVAFLFPGQGAQRVNMLRDLVTALPALHTCFAQPGARLDAQPEDAAAPLIADLIYPPPAFDEAGRAAQQAALNATEVAQPALGMAGMAAFAVLGSYGLRPDFLAGHSYGEYVALCAGGAITREELLRLSLARGRLAAAAPAGAMAALDVDGGTALDAIGRLGLDVAVANLNAPDQTIVAGTTAAVEAAQAALAQDGIRCRRLAVGAAFHCAHMAPVGAALARELDRIAFRPARIPVYANLDAAPYPADPARMRDMLARHIAEPVRFAEQVEAMHAAGARVFVECGPGLALTGLVGRILGARPHTLLALDAPGRNGWVQLGHLLAQAEAAGLPVDLAPWFAGRGLAETGLDAAFAQARARGEHGPLVWRVNGGRAAPWTAPPDETPSGDSHPPDRRTTMTTMKPDADGEQAPAPVPVPVPVPPGAPPAPPELGQVNHALGQLLAFQSEQQHSLRHFLDLQGQLAGLAPARQPRQPGLPALPSLAPAPAPALPQAVVPLPIAAPSVAPPPAAQGKPVQVPVLPAFVTGASPAAPASATPAAAASPAEFEADLLHAVAERTGYPVDMLDMDAHMEADLGIDSIKRIEIFSNLTQRHSLVVAHDEEKMIEDLAGFKTLREVVDWYARLLAPENVAMIPPAVEAAPPKKPMAPPSPSDEEVERNVAMQADSQAESDPVLSYVVRTRRAELAAGMAPWPLQYPVVLVGKPSPLAAALRAVLEAQGCTVRQLVPGLFTRRVDADHVEVDFSALEPVARIAELLPAAPQRIGALVNLMGSDAGDHRHDARALFMLLKVLGPDLRRSAADGAGRLLNLTAFGGGFGLDGPSAAAADSAGTLGVAKSAAREWGEMRVRCVDAAPTLEPGLLAGQLLAELFAQDGDIEVGLTAEGRHTIGLEPRPLAPAGLERLTLEPGAVVLVTGGAYGITADLARMLAERYRPRLVLAGRSALTGDEPEATRAIPDAAGLRAFLGERLRQECAVAGGKPRPALVEAELKRILKEREIRANLAALRAAGSSVEYHALDVRDGAAFGALIDDVVARLGRIDGVLHGAGVISDKLIAAKPLDAFDAVFDTKVVPARLLAARLDLARLRFIVFLSSVAGRFGNIGQADYSAANEVLNKLAGQLSHAWPQLHALAINWGPWDVGMVTDDLRRLYAARSIRPIAPRAGQRHFLDELARGPQRQAEVVIASSIGQIAALRLAH